MNQLKEQFQKDGYLTVKGLLGPSEVINYKTILQKRSGLTDKDFNTQKARQGGFAAPDEITQNPDLWPLIFNTKLLQNLRSILGPTLRYTQHSDIHVHHGTVGWHRDSKDRKFGIGSDWSSEIGEYNVLRIAIYLQPYKGSGSMLGVIPGTHKKESLITKADILFGNGIRKVCKRSDWLVPLLVTKPVWIKTEPGDCIIFDQRVIHSGSHIHGPKYAMFLSYGVDNEHSRRHRKYYLYERKQYREYPPELATMLRKEDLYLDLSDKETLAPLASGM